MKKLHRYKLVLQVAGPTEDFRPVRRIIAKAAREVDLGPLQTLIEITKPHLKGKMGIFRI
jgi:hypothetical protein